MVILNILNLFLNSDSVYNKHGSQADGMWLEISHFGTSVHESTKHFGLSFAYDALKIWSDLPDDISFLPLLYTHSERS